MQRIMAFSSGTCIRKSVVFSVKSSCITVAVTEENFPFRLPSTWNWGDWILSIRFKRMVTQVFPLASTSTRALLFKALSVIDWPST